jgi:excisionase family DNA binding protein
MDDILTVQEVADYLKISKTTIWRWCKEKKLGASKLGHSWRIHRAEVERVLAEGLDEPPYKINGQHAKRIINNRTQPFHPIFAPRYRSR